MSEEEAIKYLTNIKDDIFIHFKNHGWIYDINRIIDVDNAIIAIETVLKGLENLKIAYKLMENEALRDGGKKIKELETELKKAKDNEYSANCIINDLLDEIEKQDKEIERLEKELKELKRDFDIVDHENDRLEKIDIKKDKIIRAMAEEIFIRRSYELTALTGIKRTEEEIKDWKDKIIKEYEEKNR